MPIPFAHAVNYTRISFARNGCKHPSVASRGTGYTYRHMVKHLGILLIVGLLAPSFAAAQVGAALNANAELGVQTATGATGGRAKASATGSANMEAGMNTRPATTGNATSSVRKEQNKPATAGTRATSGKATTTRATSTDNKPAWGAKGGLIGYLKSLFGLTSGSSTADVRAEMNASTTASTTPSQGIGFFARLMGLFNFGK